MSTSPTALELSERCLDRARHDVRGPWLRATPIVLRQALEEAIGARLRSQVSDRSSMRAKLLCLSELLGVELGAEAALLWSLLSDGCHYGAYQLDPTVDQLADWTTRTATLIEQVS